MISFFDQFFRFWVHFWCLESLKLVLPPAREHNFYKIRIFGFITKIDPNFLGSRHPNPFKNQEKLRKKRLLKQVRFWHRFCSIFIDFWVPSWLPKKLFFRYFFQDGPRMGPRGAQEAPRGSQEASKSRFWELLAFILEGFGHHFLDLLEFFPWYSWALGLALVPVHVLPYFPYV